MQCYDDYPMMYLLKTLEDQMCRSNDLLLKPAILYLRKGQCDYIKALTYFCRSYV
jgi:hypothetical protein